MKDAVETGIQDTTEYAEKECEVCMNGALGAAERIFKEHGYAVVPLPNHPKQKCICGPFPSCRSSMGQRNAPEGCPLCHLLNGVEGYNSSTFKFH